MVQAVLFDLDGTLLPMVQEEFIKGYFGALCRRFAPKGYEPKRMIDTLWKGTAAMVRNDGACPNRDRFWAAFAEEFGQERLQDVPEFDDFYGQEFNEAAACTQPTPLADRCVKTLREKGYPVILATNPLFPRVGTLSRIRWAGLDAADFALITTYENATHCKPRLLRRHLRADAPGPCALPHDRERLHRGPGRGGDRHGGVPRDGLPHRAGGSGPLPRAPRHDGGASPAPGGLPRGAGLTAKKRGGGGGPRKVGVGGVLF